MPDRTSFCPTIRTQKYWSLVWNMWLWLAFMDWKGCWWRPVGMSGMTDWALSKATPHISCCAIQNVINRSTKLTLGFLSMCRRKVRQFLLLLFLLLLFLLLLLLLSRWLINVFLRRVSLDTANGQIVPVYSWGRSLYVEALPWFIDHCSKKTFYVFKSILCQEDWIPWLRLYLILNGYCIWLQPKAKTRWCSEIQKINSSPKRQKPLMQEISQHHLLPHGHSPGPSMSPCIQKSSSYNSLC